jgi:hypothetical protein
VHPELAQDVLHVRPHGVRRQEQPLGDGLAAQPGDHAPQHLPLPGREGLHEPLALGAVLAGRRQLAQDAGEQRGRQMGLVAQDSPDDGEQPGQRAVLGDPPAGTGLQGERGPPRIVLLGEHHDPYAGLRGTHPDHQ